MGVLLGLLLLLLLGSGQSDEELPPDQPTLELGPPVFGQIGSNGQAVINLSYKLFPVGGNKAWEVVEGPSGVQVGITNTGEKSASFSFTVAGNYLIKLTYTILVTGQVLTDTVLCQVDPVEPPVPVLSLGADLQLQLLATGVVSAVINYTCNRIITGKTWEVLVGPAGSQVNITDTGLLQARMEFTMAGDYTVELRATVSNPSGSVSDSVIVQVVGHTDPPPDLPDPPPGTIFLSGNLPDGLRVTSGHYAIQGEVRTPKSLVFAGTSKLWGREKWGSDIHFTNVNNALFQGGVFNPDSDIGLWIEGQAQIDYRGNAKEAWGYGLKTHATWKPNDEIVECPMTWGEITTQGFKRYTQGAPLRTMPNGQMLPTLNLTRGVKMRGEAGHLVHYRNVSTARNAEELSYCEFSYFGLDKLGRYPVHHHMRMDATRGIVHRGLVVKHSKAHAFVAHMSHGVTFQDCIAYDVEGEAYWYDPTSRTDPGQPTGDPSVTNDLHYIRCVAAHSPNDTDFRHSGFRLARSLRGNMVRGCLAVGIGGRGLGPGGSGTGSAYFWTESDSNAEIPSIWEPFEDNVALACAGYGWGGWQNSGNVRHAIASHGKFTAINCRRGGYTLGAYRNKYEAKKIEIYNSDPESRGLEIWAVDTFHHDIKIRGGKHGIALRHHTLPHTRPTRVQNVDIQGTTGRKVYVQENAPSSKPNEWELVNCSLNIQDPMSNFEHFDQGIAAGSVIKMQEGNQARRIASNGQVTTIPPFA